MADSFAIEPIAETSTTTGQYGQYFSPIAPKPVAPVSNRNQTSIQDDTATLSTTAQAKLWNQQGLTVIEIANQLGVPISTVQDDLGFATAAPQTYAATA